MFITKGQMKNAFSAWDKRYRENPEEFMTEVQHLLHTTPDTYGDIASVYFIHCLKKQKCPTGFLGIITLLVLVFCLNCTTKETTITQVYEPNGYTLSVKCDGNWTATINDSTYSEYGSRDFSIPGNYILARVDRVEDAFIYVALYRGWEMIEDARSRNGLAIVMGDSL